MGESEPALPQARSISVLGRRSASSVATSVARDRLGSARLGARKMGSSVPQGQPADKDACLDHGGWLAGIASSIVGPFPTAFPEEYRIGRVRLEACCTHRGSIVRRAPHGVHVAVTWRVIESFERDEVPI
jgi:hypothetical protein